MRPTLTLFAQLADAVWAFDKTERWNRRLLAAAQLGPDQEKRAVKAIRKALKNGAQAEAMDEGESCSALHLAAKNAGVGVVEALIAAGAPLESEAMNAFTPLMTACEAQRCDIAARLLAAGANPNATSNAFKTTPLSLAVTRGSDASSAALCEVLLRHGAQVNFQDYLGHSALHHAHSCDPSVIDALMAHGADPLALDHQDKTPAAYVAGWTGQSANAPLLALLRDQALALQERERIEKHLPAPAPTARARAPSL